MYGMYQPVPYIVPQTGQWVIPGNQPPVPQNTTQTASQAPQDGLIRVHGMERCQGVQNARKQPRSAV